MPKPSVKLPPFSMPSLKSGSASSGANPMLRYVLFAAIGVLILVLLLSVVL
jgi:hypothetical protein